MITWILEEDIFNDNDDRLKNAALSAGHNVKRWTDEWHNFCPKSISKEDFVLFHGSLGTAKTINGLNYWLPGSFCKIDKYYCSEYYPKIKHLIINEIFEITTVNNLVNNTKQILLSLNISEQIFVRPDSPFKPFSGRVLQTDNINLKALDHGFYYEDINLPIIVAKVRPIENEWRFVISKDKVITGSSYLADGRTEGATIIDGEQFEFMKSIVSEIPIIDTILIVDLCKTNSEYKILELNPFSGADLYACDRSKIVDQINELI